MPGTEPSTGAQPGVIAAPPTPLVTPPLPGDPTPLVASQPAYDQRGPWVVTGLREYDGVMEWELPRHVGAFHGGGSSRCEICLPERGLSAMHFLLERRERGVRLYDLHSRHGVCVMDSPVTTADLRPGSMFTARPVTFIAMNDAMRQWRPELVEIAGARWHHSPDWLMAEAVGSGHLVITGERGCEQAQLATALHEMSPRQVRDLIDLDPATLDRARLIEAVRRASRDAAIVGTTVLLRLGSRSPRLDETFLDMLYSSAYGIRVIVIASSLDDARNALGERFVSLCQHILLRPLAYRTDEIDQLLDRRFALRGASKLRAVDLLYDNRAALQQYSWPDNLAELRLIADILVAHQLKGGWRGAELDTRIPKTTMQDHIERIGLKANRVESERRGATRYSFFKPTVPENNEALTEADAE
jgi:hypothetical protein